MLNSVSIAIDLNWEGYVTNPNNYVKGLYTLVDFAYHYKLEVFYSERQLNEFRDNCNSLDENFIVSEANILAMLLQNATKKEDAWLFKVIPNEQQSTLNFFTTTQLIESHQHLAIVSLALAPSAQTLLAVTSTNKFFPLDTLFFNSREQLRKWLSKLSEPRNFIVSAKHGENGLGNWAGESVLMCSRDRAQVLLNSAIPDLRERHRLFNFDDVHNCYVEFFFNGQIPQREWHGFHVLDSEIARRVPSTVRRFFEG